MAVRGRLYGCPVELALDVIGGKWKTVILARLKEGASRYSALRRVLPDLSDKVLTQRLRELEDAGLVSRSALDGGNVHYSLTPYGLALAPALTALYAWGETAAVETGARFRGTPRP